MWSPLLRMGAGLLDLFGALLGAAGVDPVPLVPADLRRRAIAQTGLEDFGTLEYPDALDVACGSLASEANLSMVGRLAIREQLVGALTTRLIRIRLLQERPEVFDKPLNRPLIVVGLPRSGTTALHRLLAEAPDARPLYTWEIRRPLALPSRTDRRRRDADLAVWALHALAPDLMHKHAILPNEPEECVGLFDSALWTPMLWRLAGVRSYQAWYWAQDPVPAYRVYRQHLQLLQAQTPDKRLVLKLPNHLAFVDVLAEVIPEAAIVQTHRDPADVVASYNSLMCTVHRSMSRHVPIEQRGRDGLELWARHAERGLAARAKVGEGRLIDVDYRAYVADPVAQARRIHTHFELPFSGAVEDAMRVHVEQRGQHRFGRHVYTLGDYGLSREQVRDRFTPYIERFAL